MNTVIIKYNAGNVQSVMYALDRLGASYTLTDDEATIRAADRVIFPGVGEASTAMTYLRQRGLDRLIPSLRQPVLGTCIGMQLMCRHSEENDTTCMGIFDIDVRRFPASAGKVPHMGWNSLHSLRGPLATGIPPEAYVYFVHSYAADVCPHTTAICDYGHPFSAMLQRDNFYAAQFHAEISGNIGQRILDNFLKINE
jgi:imidazole glycerol-phosphate synthase subunit HisH